MRDLKKMRERHEFSLDNREMALIFAALLLLLVLSFALGVMAGKGMKGEVLVSSPAVLEPLQKEGVRGEEMTPPAREAGAGSPVTETGTAPTATAQPQFTFYETLTKITPETMRKKEEKTPPEAVRKKEDKPPLPETGTEGGKYSIQLSSSQERKRSISIVEGLKRKGYPVFLEEVDIAGKGTWYRVKVGHFASRDEASKYARIMKIRERISTFVIVAGEQ